MADLQGKVLVVLEARMPSELAGLVERHGGQAVVAPALREVPALDSPEITSFLSDLKNKAFDLVIYMTGVGAKGLFTRAEAAGDKEAVLAALRETKVVCRGPKPLGVMRAHDVPVAVIAPEPFTTESLIEAIGKQGWELTGKRVAVQHHGERNTALCDWLASQGAQLAEVSPYGWSLPDDITPLERAIRRMVDRDADAILFTTQIQVRHLFQVAERLGLRDALKDALKDSIAVAPVGPICVQALQNEGVGYDVLPEHPKMGPLVLAVADYFEKGGKKPSALPR